MLFRSFMGFFFYGLPFFSRRIGVAKDIEGNTIENRINSGIRLSGKLNKNLRIGFLNMVTEADTKNNIPSNLNSLITLRQKVFNRSSVSLFFIDRRTTKDYDFINKGEKANSVLGLEYNLASKDSKWTGRTFIHKSYKSDEVKDISTGFSINKNTRKSSFGFKSIYTGDDFQSDLGYYRRTGFVKIRPNYKYRIYPKQAIKNAKRIMKKTRCDAIKIENNSHNLNIVKAFTKSKKIRRR